MAAPSECSTPVRTLKKFLKNHVGTRAIVLSDVKEPETIGMRNLPCEWLKQPVDQTELLARIETTARAKVPDRGGSSGSAKMVVPVEIECILAFNLKMKNVIQYIIEAAAQDIPVLITGETGTGKDLVAAAIHKRSKRNNFPYLPVNMGAIAPELVA